MKALFENILDGHIIKSIYITLFQSLWQGALLAVIAGMIMMTTKKSRPVLRYNLLLGSLLLFVIGSMATFVGQFVRALKTHSSITTPTSFAGNIGIQFTSGTETFGFTDHVIAFLNDNASYIVAFWFLVICFKSVQLLVGLSGAVNLKKNEIHPAGEVWEQRLTQLAVRLSINNYIQIFQSGLVKVPLTLGFLKPVILVPVGMLTAIPQDQVESILLHELAHIRRKDYIVNIFQCLFEILFFFNPAVAWVSSLIRAERENCCDDLAISQSRNKSDYLKALISFEEIRFPLLKYAAGLSGSKNNLLTRAKRIINNQNKTLNLTEKILLTSGLIMSSLMIVTCTQIDKQKSRFINIPTTMPEMMAVKSTDTSFANEVAKTKDQFPQNVTLNETINAKEYKLKTDSSKIIELYVDDEQVANEKILAYKKVTDQMFDDFWTKAALINQTSRKVNATVVSMRKSIDRQKVHLQDR